MIVYMYFTTDGDAGYYQIKLFKYRIDAEKYAKMKNDAYGNTAEIEVDEGFESEEKKHPIEDTLCPDCGEKMISRKGQYGVFFGCSKYPKCRGTRDSQGRSKEERNRENEQRDSQPASQPIDEKFRFRRDV